MSLPRIGPVALLCLLLFAPNASAQRETFEDETSTILVEVPVTIIHDGEPVRGLERDAFHVFDGRKEQEIVDFEVIDLATITEDDLDDPLALPAGARRHFMLLFDFSFSRPITITRAREAARKLVREDLHPSDLVSVATYSARGPELLLGFTPDRRQVELALARLGLEAGPRRASDPLGLTLASPGEVASALSGRASLADDEIGSQRGFARQIERDYGVFQVTGMTRAMTELAKVLDGADGKKHLVYLTEGFDSRLMVGGPSPDGGLAAMRGDLGNVDSRDTFGDPRVLSSLDRMLTEFRRSDVTIQVVDIHGLETAGSFRRLNQQALFYIANETGGELYETYNDLHEAMGEMLERTSVTYLLTFRAEDLPEDGSYRRLRVEIDGLPRWARVKHRAGYSAPRPPGERPPLAQRLTAAQELLSAEPATDFEIALLMVPFPRAHRANAADGADGADAKAHVPVVVQVDGPGFLDGFDGQLTQAEVFVYALDPQGNVLDYFAQRIDLNLYRFGATLRHSGLKAAGHLELPPGSHTVRVLVRNGRSGAASLRVATLEVPPPDDGSPTLLPPFFPDPPGSWMMSPGAEKAAASQDFEPFSYQGERYLPAVRPRLVAGQAAAVHLVAYGLGAPERLQVSTRVLDEAGRSVGRATLRLDGRLPSASSDDPVAHLSGRLETESLDPGPYRLEVTLSDPESGRETTNSAPFRVEPPTG